MQPDLEWDLTTSLEGLCHCLTTLIINYFFLISNLGTLFWFKTISPCPIAAGSAKKFVFLKSSPSLNTERLQWSFCRAFSSSGWTVLTLSGHPQRRGVFSLCSSSWPSSAPAPGLSTDLVKHHEIPMSPHLEPVQVPLDGITFFKAWQLHHLAWCHLQNLLKVHLMTLSMSLRKVLNSHSHTCHWSPFGH